MSVFIGYPSFMAYEMMKGKKGNNDGFPSIPGMIARYSASGLTNEQMKENPVWVDKTGNGHDLQMKNFLWGGMSGVGGYKLNWGDSSIRSNHITQGVRGTGEVTDNTIHITSVKSYNALFETRASLKSVEYKVLIKGLTDDIYLRYGVFNDGKALWTEIKNDGIYTLPSYDYDNRYNMMWKVMSQTYPIDCNITIEQLPLYPGALVFDGVDDYGVCDNFPILTKEKGYTVVALRQWTTPETKTNNEVLVSNLRNEPKWTSINLGAFQFEVKYNTAKIVQTDSFGKANNVIVGSIPPLSYQTSNSYNGSSIVSGYTKSGGNFLTVGCGGDQFHSNVAIWELVFLDHDATEEELTKIKDYFVKAYPWLFPNQAWTVTGKTNEDEDRATIANITGNGNDLVLSNFGFAEGSGYGLYQQNYAIWTKVSNRATFTVTSSKIHVTSVTAEEHADFIYTTGQQLKQKIRITGLPEGVSFVIGRSGVNLKIISQDGIYDVDILDDSSANPIIGYRIDRIVDSCDITIEQIPEYEGYLVTDGVDDKIVSSIFKLGKDFTVVGEWEFLQDISNNSGLRKTSSFIIRNNASGLSLFINRTSQATTVFNVKSLKAVCSNGMLVKNDWTEQIDTVSQIVTSSNSKLLIACRDDGVTEYDKFAFKNLAIYPMVLSKDDCIKAYNYLQTLKAK